jgi:cell division protein FtsI (penicillin-binding protein 3)
VILDSAVGPHQGGQVSAPVFSRVSQQVLEYLHVPHDLPLAPKHQLLLAQSKINDKDLVDDTPDHPGEPLLETAEVSGSASDAATSKPSAASALAAAGTPKSADGTADQGGRVVQAAMREREDTPPAQPVAQPQGTKSGAPDPEQPAAPLRGTVVLDVEQGGIEVPSFVGKTVRSAIEAAQDAGLELEAVGSGVARQQTPAAGTHVTSGARITVQFGR